MARATFQVLVLPFRQCHGRFEVAVLRRKQQQLWQFISGGGEANETPPLAACREANEEAAIPVELPYLPLDTTCTVPAAWFGDWATWPEHVFVVTEHAFAVGVGTRELRLSDEHDAQRWVSYDEAWKLLEFDSNRCALWELHERLYPSPRTGRSVEHEVTCPCRTA